MKPVLSTSKKHAILCLLILCITPSAVYSQTGESANDSEQEQQDETGQQRQQLVLDLKEQLLGIVVERLFENHGAGESDREHANHVMIITALEEAIRASADDYAAQLLRASFLDDSAAIGNVAQLWHEAQPTTMEATFVLFVLRDKQLTADGGEDTKPLKSGRATADDWRELISAIALPDAAMGEYAFESFVRYFVLRDDFNGALRILTEFAKRPEADARGLFLNFLSLRQIQRRRGFNANQAGERYIECIEHIIAAAIQCKAQVSEMTRSDIFGYLMSDYSGFIRNARQCDRGLAFLNEQKRQVGLMGYEQEETNAFNEMIDGSVLILLANTDRSAASKMALERLEERLQRFDVEEIAIAELAAAFEVAFLLADSTGLESVYARFDSYQFLSDETVVKHLQDKQDTEQDLEWNRQAINSAWNSLFSRLVSDGKTAVTATNWERLRRLEGQMVSFEGEGPKYVLDDESFSRIIQADLRFNHFISQFAATNPGKSLLEEFSFENEAWFNQQPTSAAELAGKIVVLVLLTSDGFGGSDAMFFEEIINSTSGKNGNPGQLLVVVDDDGNEDRFADKNQVNVDEWYPEGRPDDTASVNERVGLPESIQVPVVYAYKNKFIDALIPNTNFEYFDFHRVLIFDGRGMLRRVVCPGHEKFESIADTVDRLALENGGEFKSDENDK